MWNPSGYLSRVSYYSKSLKEKYISQALGVSMQFYPLVISMCRNTFWFLTIFNFFF